MTVLEFIAFAAILYLLLEIRNSKTDFTHKEEIFKTSIVLDTSAAIDGRVLDVFKSRFLFGKVIIPKRVLAELQQLADGSDAYKRSRARYGLDIINELKQLKYVAVSIDTDHSGDDMSTDEAVVSIAKKHSARLCTTDFNLNKVAVAEGLAVLNVNELAQAVRQNILPGEIITIKILQKGESKGQGIGYLNDGTLVVVDGAVKLVGATVSVRVDRMIQTQAGKMIFAVLKN